MHEVVDDVDAVHRLGEGGRVEGVAPDDLHIVGPGHAGELVGSAGEAPDLVAGAGQAGRETAADVAGCAHDEDLHVMLRVGGDLRLRNRGLAWTTGPVISRPCGDRRRGSP